MGKTPKPNFISVPEIIRKRLLIMLKIDNSQRIYVISWIGFLFLFLFLGLDYIRYSNGKIQLGNLYFILFLAHLVFILFLFPIISFRKNREAFADGRFKYGMYFIYTWTLFLGVILIAIAVLSLIERGSLTMYAIYIIIANLVLIMRNQDRIILNLLSFFVISFAIIQLFHHSPEWLYIHFLEAIGVTVTSFIVSTVIFNAYVREIHADKLMEIKKDQLEKEKTLSNELFLRLKEHDAIKTKLYTNITHEFRTPLTVILGMADQIKGQVSETAKEEGLKMIRRNGNQLLNLVNQMLDLRKLESGTMSVKLVQGDILLYFKYILESFHSYNESKDIRLHFLSDLTALNMDYDPEKILTIVSNLLSNAIKFTGEGGDVYLIVESDQGEHTTGDLQLKIKDTGIGIPEEKLPHIFDRFYQVDDEATRKAEGTGIGLALTKELVKLLGGKISVISSVGKGTEFRVTLPITREAELADTIDTLDVIDTLDATLSTTSVIPEVSKDQPLILVIEDNKDVRSYLQTCLSAAYQLQMAENGQLGIERALEQIPDLIISDIMMPLKDGFEVCDTLKNDERTSHIPIIMLTAKADVQSRLSGLRRGADAYLAKPFNKEELLIRIAALIEQRRKLQAYYLSQATVAKAPTAAGEISEEHTVENVFVHKIRRIIETHLDEPSFSVEQLCREAALSQAQLFRKLKALIGKSAIDLIRSIRLSKARELLKDPELSITAVAYDTGFNDPLYFSKVFRKEFGMTPTEFRKE